MSRDSRTPKREATHVGFGVTSRDMRRFVVVASWAARYIETLTRTCTLRGRPTEAPLKNAPFKM